MIRPVYLVTGWVALTVWGFWRYEASYMIPREAIPVQAGATQQFVAPGKYTLVIAWSPTCPCSAYENDHIKKIAKDFPSLRIVGLIEGTESHAWSQNGLPGSLLLDPVSKVARSLGIGATPGSVLIGPDGSIDYRGSLHAGRFCNNDAVAFAYKAVEQRMNGERVSHPDVPFFGCAVAPTSE